MKKFILKEGMIYLVLFVFLAIAMHFKACITHPLEHIKALPTAPLGTIHPLLFTFLVYLVVLIVRISIRLVKKFF